jgi:ATP-dependent Clp protease protease subunit
MILDKTDDPSPIQLYLSSPGGSIDAGMAIVDVMEAIEKEVDTYCVGLSSSMAAVIFSCGKKRFMYPSSKLMIHDPLLHQTGGNALQLKAISDSLLEYRETIGKLLARNTGKTIEEIYELTKQDTYMNAEECIRNNFADFIVGKD